MIIHHLREAESQNDFQSKPHLPQSEQLLFRQSNLKISLCSDASQTDGALNSGVGSNPSMLARSAVDFSSLHSPLSHVILVNNRNNLSI